MNRGGGGGGVGAASSHNNSMKARPFGHWPSQLCPPNHAISYCFLRDSGHAGQHPEGQQILVACDRVFRSGLTNWRKWAGAIKHELWDNLE
jgi:hypothetical protein